MAAPENALDGSVMIPAEQVSDMVRRATLLPSAYFITVGKAKIDQQTGNMTCKYTASTVAVPPPPSDTKNGGGK